MNGLLGLGVETAHLLLAALGFITALVGLASAILALRSKRLIERVAITVNGRLSAALERIESLESERKEQE